MQEIKLNGESMNIVEDNIEKLKTIFPDVFTEGKVDFEKLQGVLGNYIETNDERYNFTWAGKQNALRLAQTPSTGTLRPCKDENESKNWDTTQNLYIEGDNLEVLKLLQKSYHNKIKMIYIDPPYNTGTDFVYKDDFKDNIENYKKITGQIDEDGNKISSNSESDGRYHTNWLNMMYPRLRLARNLLTNDGVIFISIDDIEVTNLRKVCDSIFGEQNFVATLVWEKKKKGSFLSKHYINMKEYIIVYTKSACSFNGLIGEINESSETYPCIKTTNARGIRTIRKGTLSKYKENDYFINKGTRISSGNMELIYLDDLDIKDGVLVNDVRIDSNWIYTQESLDEFAKKGLIYITQDLYIRRIVDEDRIKKIRDLLLRIGSDGISSPNFIYSNNLNNSGWGTNEDANNELHQLFGVQYSFDFSKPSKLIAKLIQSLNDKHCIILDFFSGSATMADACLQLNSNDNGNRKYICVQIPEQLNKDVKEQKVAYNFLNELNKPTNICELGKERIRRAGDKIKQEIEQENQQLKLGEEPKQVPDIGFKVFKLDSSNIKKWNANTENLEEQLQQSILNQVAGRSELDVVYEIMLKCGLDLTYPIEEIKVENKTLYSVGAGAMFICMDDNITQSIADKIISIKEENEIEEPVVVFKDNGFIDDSTKTNIKESLRVAGIKDFITV